MRRSGSALVGRRRSERSLWFNTAHNNWITRKHCVTRIRMRVLLRTEFRWRDKCFVKALHFVWKEISENIKSDIFSVLIKLPYFANVLTDLLSNQLPPCNYYRPFRNRQHDWSRDSHTLLSFKTCLFPSRDLGKLIVVLGANFNPVQDQGWDLLVELRDENSGAVLEQSVCPRSEFYGFRLSSWEKVMDVN